MVDEQKIAELTKDLEEKFNYFDNLIETIVSENLSAMDKILEGICDNIVNVENPSTEIIEKYFLELTNCLYFMQERVEKLNIYDSLSKISYKSEFNNSYLNPTLEKAKPTVNELNAYAENNTIYEQALNEMYNKAYRIVKAKIDSAQTMVQTLSKVLSKRITDTQLSNKDSTSFYINPNKQLLNE